MATQCLTNQNTHTRLTCQTRDFAFSMKMGSYTADTEEDRPQPSQNSPDQGGQQPRQKSPKRGQHKIKSHANKTADFEVTLKAVDFVHTLLGSHTKTVDFVHQHQP